ncbi:MAG: HD domain-containing protein [Gammaproteobacteria bacterium]|nr:MAG: HD domain-containing protein [Gammaproteobacteria bacterium]
MTDITCPQFTELESELIDEFVACFQENVEEIENALDQLDETPGDEALINELFRAMHSLKGNCRMVFLEPLVDVIHLMEELVSDMREGQRAYQPAYGLFFLALINEVETLIGDLVREGACSADHVELLRHSVETLAQAGPEALEAEVDRVRALLAGETPGQDEPPLASRLPRLFRLGECDDLALMQAMARQLDGLSVYRNDRTARELRLCQAINRHLGHPVDDGALEAAVLMHDVGMALVPHSIFNKTSELSRDERKQVEHHVAIGAQLLHKLGWEDAARIVLHHHEHFDGSGYPAGLSGEDIPLGARILSVVDTFLSVTQARADRSYKKSLFSAITEINAGAGRQYDPDIVEALNMAVRELYVSGASGAG